MVDAYSVLLTIVTVLLMLPLLLFAERYLPSDLRPYFSSPERIRLQTELDQLRAEMSAMAKDHEQKFVDLRESYERRIEDLKQAHISQLATLINMMHETKVEVSTMKNGSNSAPRRPIRVLAIWPQYEAGNLGLTQEAQGMFNSGVSYSAVTGPLERKDVVRALRRGKYNVLQIDAHGTKQYIYLNDNTPTLPGWWARLVKEHDIDLVVLMSCDSESEMGDALLRNGVDAVITVDGEIKDSAAVDFVTALYEDIASGDSLKFAVERAKLVMNFDQQSMIHLWGEDLWKEN